MLSEGGLLGLGIHGTYNYLKHQGIHYDLHNTYLRIFCECGAIVGTVMIALAAWLLRSLCKDIWKNCDLEALCLPLVLLSGLFSGLWEPQAVFGTVNWWSLWWFVLGVYIANKRFINDQNELANDVEFNQIE